MKVDETKGPVALPPAPTRTPRRRIPWKLALAVVVGLTLGSAVGAALTPRNEDERASLRSQLAESLEGATQAERLSDIYRSMLETTRATRDELTDVQQDLEGRITDLREQNADLRETIARLRRQVPTGPSASFGAGTYRVGEEIQPGTYRANGGDSCYWERLRGFTGELESIIANGFADRNPTVTIASTDAGFSSRDCGTWTRV